MKPTRGECGALGQERSSDVRTGGSPVWLDVVRVGISRHDEEGTQAKPRGEVGSKGVLDVTGTGDGLPTSCCLAL